MSIGRPERWVMHGLALMSSMILRSANQSLRWRRRYLLEHIPGVQSCSSAAHRAPLLQAIGVSWIWRASADRSIPKCERADVRILANSYLFLAVDVVAFFRLFALLSSDLPFQASPRLSFLSEPPLQSRPAPPTSLKSGILTSFAFTIVQQQPVTQSTRRMLKGWTALRSKQRWKSAGAIGDSASKMEL